MSQTAFSTDAATIINPHSQRLAYIRQQILTLFMEDEEFVHALIEKDQHVSMDDKAFSEKISAVKELLIDLHTADIADILEMLPYDERLALWRLVDNNERGEVLVEASVSVWDSLIKDMSD